jgi:hypothetical protein
MSSKETTPGECWGVENIPPFKFNHPGDPTASYRRIVWVRGVDHTGQFRYYPLTSSAVIMWKVVGQHLFLIIISNNFTTGMRRKVWCDRGMRGWSHRLVQTPFDSISGYNSVKSGGPTFIYQHNLQRFHGWNRTESSLWSGHEGLITHASSDNIRRHLRL